VGLAIAAAGSVAGNEGNELLELSGQLARTQDSPSQGAEGTQQIWLARHCQHAVGNEAHYLLDGLEQRLEVLEI
jgi:hypothetical protein